MVAGPLRAVLTGVPHKPLVLVGNFEVEDVWAAGEQGLPVVAMAGSRLIVNRMDEFALLLAGPGDAVVLKAAPDPGYLSYLRGLGLALPRVLAPDSQDPRHSVTADALAAPRLLAELRELAGTGARLWPHGVSHLEEELAARSGLPLAAPPAPVCKAVNSKIYSRLAADRAGVRQPEGMVCRDLDELDAACGKAAGWLAAGRPVVVKDAFGVSGKGILVVREPARLDQVRRMVTRRAGRAGDPRVALVVEEWLPKQTDLNYQFTVDTSGRVEFSFVKEAVNEGGIHKGHRMPARLTGRQRAEVEETAVALGVRLAADGYFGIVGVDALVCDDGRLFPMIEINARNNMSTYQERLREAFIPSGYAALATQYAVRLARAVAFDQLRERLDGLLLAPGRDTGVLVNNFATLNAAAGAAGAGNGFDGRLYAIIIDRSAEGIAAIDRELARRVQTLGSQCR